jgi:hypothetical protein
MTQQPSSQPPKHPFDIEIGEEVECSNYWSYMVRVFEGGKTYNFEVSLGWADYDLWSHGRIPPSRVVHAAFVFLLQREPASAVFSKFDCSVIRRYFPEVDKELPKRL